MTTVLTALFWTCAVLILICHVGSVLLDSVLGRVAGYLGVVLHIPLYLLSSILYQRLELTLLILMVSLLVYLIIGAVKYKISDKKSAPVCEKGEGESDK